MSTTSSLPTHSTHHTHSTRHLRSRRFAAFAALTLAFTTIGALAADPAEATSRRVRSSSGDFSVTISPDAIRVDAGGVASFPVQLRFARTTVRPVFDIDGLPNAIDAEIERLSSSRYRLDLFVPVNAPSSNGVYKLVAKSGSRTRIAYLRLEVVGRVVVTQPPITVPATLPPTTVPPVVVTPVPPVTQPANFGVSVDTSERFAQTDETAQYRIAVDRSAGYTGPVQFTLQNVPAGLVAGYVPNPTTAGTVLLLTPKSNTPAGRHVMTVIGSAGSTQRSVLIALTVRPTGDFSLLASPTTVTRSTPGNATYRIDVGTSLQARPFIDYTVEGLPTGATAKFSSNGTNATPVNMTISTATSTPNGTYNLVITGRSGAVVRQFPVQLVVAHTTSGFSIAADNSTYSIARGSSKVIQLTVRPFGGFTGTITTSLAGLPTGVTVASIGATSSTVNQQFTIPITVQAAPTAGVTTVALPITITSSGSSVSASVTVLLTVV